MKKSIEELSNECGATFAKFRTAHLEAQYHADALRKARRRIRLYRGKYEKARETYYKARGWSHDLV